MALSGMLGSSVPGTRDSGLQAYDAGRSSRRAVPLRTHQVGTTCNVGYGAAADSPAAGCASPGFAK